MFGWGKRALAAALPLLLASCLWGPGKFTSDLALRKNGTFTLDYRGEIWLQLPEDKGTPPEPWSEKMAHCYADGRSTNFPVVAVVTSKPDGTPGDAPPEPKRRPCTKAELDKLKTDHERNRAERIESKSQESDQMAKMFRLPGRTTSRTAGLPRI